MSDHLAVDIGGTFTDVAFRRADGAVETFKVSTDRARPDQAVKVALDQLVRRHGELGVAHVRHGTTIGTNALLEGATPPIALVTTAGFRDVLQIGRLKRADLYDIGWDPIAPLVSRDRIFELDESIGPDGVVRHDPDPQEVERLVTQVLATGVRSVAVCLINAHASGRHEVVVADALRRTAGEDLFVTLSHQVDGQLGEYERMSTTVVNAALRPVMSEYVGSLAVEIRLHAPNGRLFIMQSSGGLATGDQIAEEPARAVESGPAAGALYAGTIARRHDIDQAIAFDMGGTTAKACLLEGGRPAETSALHVGSGMHAGEGFSGSDGYVIRHRAIDLAEVGAGGGSLCRVDGHGVLHVGPESAGAVPGPVAYGRGGAVPTVTDANVVLGYVPEGASSDVVIDRERARVAIQRDIADRLDISVEEAAWMIVEVANSNMIRAIQAVSSERGREPAESTLIAFGGGGPTHAAAIAGDLGMTKVVVPAGADCFSAVGLHTCAVRRDQHENVGATVEELDGDALEITYLTLEGGLAEALKSDGIQDWQLSRVFDACFDGQNTVLTVDFPAAGTDPLAVGLERAFLAAYEQEYGHVDRSDPIVLTAARVVAEAWLGAGPSGEVRYDHTTSPSTAPAYFGSVHGWHDTPRRDIASLAPGEVVSGPALVAAGQATAVIPPGARGQRDEEGNLRMELPVAERTTLAAGGWQGRATLQLFRNALGSVIDRMAYTLARTAHSTLVADANDFSVALGDHRGRVLDQGAGVLIHLGSVAATLEEIVERDQSLAPGDVIVLNDPYHGGTHLPDVAVVVPAFVEGRLVAFGVAIAHMVDIGGMVSGSLMGGATELLQEGLILPPVKLYEGGRPNSAVFDIISRNVRRPDVFLGDLHGIVAAASIGARRVEELVARSGVEAAFVTMDELLDYAEERGRQELLALGDGQASFVDHIDDDGLNAEPVRLEVDLRISGGEVWADLTGCSSQTRSGINAPLAVARSVVQYCIRTQLSADFPDNAGLQRLFHVEAPPGTVVNPVDDAPVVNRGITAYRLTDTVFGALAQMQPGAIWAAGDGSLDPLSFSCTMPDGQRVVVVDILGGTSGARPEADGLEGKAPPMANCRNHSVELLEARFPLRVRRYGFVSGTGGAGRHRGGNAICREYEALRDDVVVALRSDRRTFQPWGLEGGAAGAPSQVTLQDGDEVTILPSKHVLTMRAGQRLVWQGAGGGGYGPPDDRDAAARERDEQEGRV